MLHDSILTSHVSAPILIVEDNQTNALILRSMLGKHGYTSVVAHDGREGVEMTKAHRPQLVLMDLQMPRLDGFSAASEILAGGGDAPPIVAVTASVAEKVREACLAAGFSDVLSKPIMIDELIAMVRRHMPPRRHRPAGCARLSRYAGVLGGEAAQKVHVTGAVLPVERVQPVVRGEATVGPEAVILAEFFTGADVAQGDGVVFLQRRPECEADIGDLTLAMVHELHSILVPEELSGRLVQVAAMQRIGNRPRRERRHGLLIAGVHCLIIAPDNVSGLNRPAGKDPGSVYWAGPELNIDKPGQLVLQLEGFQGVSSADEGAPSQICDAARAVSQP